MNVLIIGLGSIGRKHIDALKKLQPNVIVFALRSIKNSDVYLDVINIYTLIDIKIKIDFIIISNITSEHEKSILQAIDFHCPIFIEKPVLASTINADIISQKLSSKNIHTYVACNLRFHPSIQFISNYLKTNSLKINEVNIYSGSFLPEWRTSKNFRETYSSSIKLGGGVHLDLIHEIDYCTWLFGLPENVVSVKRNVSTLNIDAYDFANYILYYPKFSATITLNYYRRDKKRQIEILTDDTTIFIDLEKNKIINLVTNEVLFSSNFNILDTYLNQMNYFIENIIANKETMNSFSYAVNILKLANNENNA
jgi:predicted dehydrogenase